MKKLILPILLLLLALVSMFVYEKEYGYKNKELPFSYALNKEYVYVKDDVKTPITIEFDDTKIYGYSGVNRYFAGYKVENMNDIQFSPIGSTMMAGPEKDMKMESEYLNLLNNVNKVEVYQGRLILKTKDNQTLNFVENKKELKKEQKVENKEDKTNSKDNVKNQKSEKLENKDIVIEEEANLPQVE